MKSLHQTTSVFTNKVAWAIKAVKNSIIVCVIVEVPEQKIITIVANRKPRIPAAEGDLYSITASNPHVLVCF